MNTTLTVPQMLSTLRIILVALIAGLVAMMAVAVFVMRPTPDPSAEKVFLLTLAVLVAGEVIAYVVVRRIWTGQLRQRFGGRQVEADEPQIIRGFWTLAFIGAAMTEGASLFAVVIYMISASRPALLVAGLGILLLLIQLPTLDRFRGFAEHLTGRRPA